MRANPSRNGVLKHAPSNPIRRPACDILWVKMFRLLLAVLAAAAVAPAAPPPGDWVPLRWEGGPLGAYEPGALGLLEDTPFNCLLLTWSLGASTSDDEAQRQAAASFAQQAQQHEIAALAVIEPGADWLEAVGAAAATGFDGVALDGLFSAGQVREASDAMAGRGVVVAMGAWRQALQLDSPAIIGSADGVWPTLFTAEDESDTFESGPTSNPWVLANSWRIAAVRAGARGRAVWFSQRPKRYSDQPFSTADYLRAVADTAMAGGRWAVTLDGKWQAGLLSGDADMLEGWRRIAAAVQFFEDHADWRELPPQPAVVVVLDPEARDVFSGGETLNLLAVRHNPHRVLLRSDFQQHGAPEGAHAVTFDFEPTPAEATALQALAAAGGTVFSGPEWALGGIDLGLPPAALGAGGVMAYPAEKLNEDQFATDLRKRLDESGATIRIFNTGTLMSFYTEAADRGVLHLTEYSDYPTDNITVRFPRKIEKAVWVPLDGEEEALEVYDTDGGGEIVIPEAASYCAVTVQFAPR